MEHDHLCRKFQNLKNSYTIRRNEFDKIAGYKADVKKKKKKKAYSYILALKVCFKSHSLADGCWYLLILIYLFPTKMEK